MKSKEYIKKWLLENAVDDKGDLILSDLDFSDFDGNVFISHMKVKRSLFQSHQEVGGDLLQNDQIVAENLYQDNQNVGEDFINHRLDEDEYWKDDNHNNYVFRMRKEEITLEELEKMGFKLKEEK